MTDHDTEALTQTGIQIDPVPLRLGVRFPSV